MSAFFGGVNRHLGDLEITAGSCFNDCQVNRHLGDLEIWKPQTLHHFKVNRHLGDLEIKSDLAELT